ncbi:MAG: B12-binding domain-containing radical SAM protein [Elusimicrobia bacterium]|nr:B12-binding domain-containing radical SAM protein [Elusimicrobiota bacterium]
MRILMIAPKYFLFPVGIAYVSASLKKAGHDIHCHVYENPERLTEMLRGSFDLAATGGLSIQFKTIREIVNIVKSTNTKILIGGGIVTSEPELISRALKVDYAVIGEGEVTAVQLLDCLSRNGNLSSVDGIGYFTGDRFIQTKERKQNDSLDDLPYPDFEGFNYIDFLDNSRPSDVYYSDLYDNPREYPLVGSRSCPFLCTFCYHPTGNKYRQRSIKSIMEELKKVIPKYRINIVGIYDELFSGNEERVYEFCREFKTFAATLPWEVKWICQLRVSGLKDELLDTMKESGCYMISYGFESYSPRVLKSMKKETTPEQIHHAVHAMLDRNISLQGGFIFGDKAETLKTAKETLDFWQEHRESGLGLAFILPYPASEMYRHCLRKGLIKDRLYFIENELGKIFNMTELPEDEFIKLRSIIFKYTYKYAISALALSLNPDTLVVKCPHCHQVVQYNNFKFPAGKLFRRIMYCRNCRKRFLAVNRLAYMVNKLIGIISTPGIFKMALKMRNLAP